MSVTKFSFLIAFATLAWAPCSLAIERETSSRCESLALRTEAELESVRPDFVHNTHYTIEVETTEIKDQCTSRSCWSYAGTSNLEQKILRETGKRVDLSEQYLILNSIRIKANEALETVDGQFAPGGAAVHVDTLVENFGIVPDSVWKPRIDFRKDGISHRFYYFLNSRIARFHVEYASTNNLQAKHALLLEARIDLGLLIDQYVGPMPREFDFEGVHYKSPLEYASAMNLLDLRPTIMLIPKEDELPEGLQKKSKAKRLRSASAHDSFFKHVESIEMTTDEIALKIVESLKRGESVRIGYESAREFYDSATGILSIGAFYVPKGFKPPSRRYREDKKFKGTGHAVEIVGADLDSEGHVIKFKIKNSHGTETGDEGYLHMYMDFFEAFVSRVFIRQSPD